MANATATATSKSVAKDQAFTWEGIDKKGNRVKGKDLAVDEQALRNDLRRRGIIPNKVAKQITLFKSGGGKVKPRLACLGFHIAGQRQSLLALFKRNIFVHLRQTFRGAGEAGCRGACHQRIGADPVLVHAITVEQRRAQNILRTRFATRGGSFQKGQTFGLAIQFIEDEAEVVFGLQMPLGCGAADVIVCEALIDALRTGRARDRAIAADLLPRSLGVDAS